MAAFVDLSRCEPHNYFFLYATLSADICGVEFRPRRRRILSSEEETEDETDEEDSSEASDSTEASLESSPPTVAVMRASSPLSVIDLITDEDVVQIEDE